MTTIFSGSHFTDKAKEAKFKPHPLLMLLVFVGLFIAFELASVFPLFLGQIFIYLSFGEMTEANADIFMAWEMVVSLLCTVIPAALSFVYCIFLEKRSAASMGFAKKGCVLKYIIGLVIGFAAFSLSICLCYAAGAVKYVGSGFENAFPVFIFLCIGWIIQGAEEEILCRGLLMGSLSIKLPLWAAVLINSGFFALLHIANTGISALALINLTICGIWLSLLAVRYNSLIPSCAAHTIWNLAQGNIYGVPVSGMTSGPSVFRFELVEGNPLWTGGEFGIEGGLGVTIVLSVLCLATWLIPRIGKSNAGESSNT